MAKVVNTFVGGCVYGVIGDSGNGVFGRLGCVE